MSRKKKLKLPVDFVDAVEAIASGPQPVTMDLAAALNASPLHFAGRPLASCLAYVLVNKERRRWTVDAGFQPCLVSVPPDEIYGIRNDWRPVVSDAKGNWSLK